MQSIKLAILRFVRNPFPLLMLNILTLGRGIEVKCAGRWPLRILWKRRFELNFRKWEKEFSDLYAATIRQGDVVFDVGAEHGEWSALAATRAGAGNVHIFEPNNAAWHDIQSIWKINNFDTPGGCWEGFVSDQDTVAPLTGIDWTAWPRWLGAKENHFESLKAPSGIRALTIDGYVGATGRVPSVIKIDIEGAEGLALKGALKTIELHRPIIFLSIHPWLVGEFGTTVDGILKLFTDLRFVYRRIAVDHEEHWVMWDPQSGRQVLP